MVQPVGLSEIIRNILSARYFLFWIGIQSF